MSDNPDNDCYDPYDLPSVFSAGHEVPRTSSPKAVSFPGTDGDDSKKSSSPLICVRMSSTFYKDHLEVSLYRLVDIFIQQTLSPSSSFYVSPEMRVLVSWVSGQDATKWPSTKVFCFVRNLCSPLTIEGLVSTHPELPSPDLMLLFHRALKDTDIV